MTPPNEPAGKGRASEEDIDAIRDALRFVSHDEECNSHENGPDTCDCGSDEALRKAKDALYDIRRRPAPGNDLAERLRVERDHYRQVGFDALAEVTKLRRALAAEQPAPPEQGAGAPSIGGLSLGPTKGQTLVRVGTSPPIEAAPPSPAVSSEPAGVGSEIPDEIRWAIEELCEAAYAFADADMAVPVDKCPHAKREREKQKELHALIAQAIAAAEARGRAAGGKPIAATEFTCIKCGCTNKAEIYEGREIK